MKVFRLIFTCVILVVLTAMVQPGTRAITGKVISFEESFPLKGVQVQAKGTTISTQTLANGTFTLSVPTSTQSLVFNADGYKPNEVRLTKESSYTVSMEKAGGR